MLRTNITSDFEFDAEIDRTERHLRKQAKTRSEQASPSTTFGSNIVLEDD